MATFDTQSGSGTTSICGFRLKDGVLRLLVPFAEQVTASNADIFILWMIGSSLVLIAIARPVPAQPGEADRTPCPCGGKFRQGASVYRLQTAWGTGNPRTRTAAAFMEMRERIERFVQQRTDMLAGISHDAKDSLDPHAAAARDDESAGSRRHRAGRRYRRNGAHAEREYPRFRAGAPAAKAAAETDLAGAGGRCRLRMLGARSMRGIALC